MKHTLIYIASLSLLLAVSPSYGDQWERQLNSRATAQSMSSTADTASNNWSAVETERRMKLERSVGQDVIREIENLPPTAAGPRKISNMSVDWAEVEANRRKQLERGLY